ncbi:hypothetical protein ACUXST_001397 [Sphingomonas sp. F9_3S_D5_B_2]
MPEEVERSAPEQAEQEALFYIEGPDERGCVWMHGTSSSDPWAENLGPQDKVAEVLSHWLALDRKRGDRVT